MPNRSRPFQSQPIGSSGECYVQTSQRASGAKQGPALVEQACRAEKHHSSSRLQEQRVSEMVGGLHVWGLGTATRLNPCPFLSTGEA